jgi:hypothetical protein
VFCRSCVSKSVDLMDPEKENAEAKHKVCNACYKTLERSQFFRPN